MCKHFFLLLSLIFFQVGFSQNYSVSGVVKNTEDNFPVLGANVSIENTSKGDVTDLDGAFSIQLKEGEYRLLISYLGFKEYAQKIKVDKDLSINILLEPESQSLEEVIITKTNDRLKLKKPQMSVNKITTKDIQNIPSVLGEADIIKAITLLPGVTNSSEGAGGFHVRGGAADQNLVLLDGASIYNDSHLFGIFSIMHPGAVKDLTLYKGGIPSKYGGRVSSVLEINQRKGNFDQLNIDGSIGLVSSKLLFEGPINKGKTSFLVAGRSSYAHLFLKLIDNPNSAYFYDINTKLSHIFDENNELEFSGYFGRDVFNINDSFKNTYGSSVAKIDWTHRFNENTNSKLSLGLSDYYFGLTLDFIGFNYNSGIRDYSLRYQLNSKLSDKIDLEYGVQSNYYSFNPGYIEPSNENSGIIKEQFTKKYAWQNAFYASAEQKFTEKLTVNYGLRLNLFSRLGQEEVNLYENGNPLVFNENLQIYEKAPIIGTENQSRSDFAKTFVNLEPRISIAYQLNEKSSVKASYQFINQYLHLISNTDAPTPLDIWAPSGKYIQPQQSHQYALGYFRKFEVFDLETEIFYKSIDNRLDYIDGADLIANDAIEQVLLSGRARAYGIEILLKKNVGRFTGWLAYTFSKSEQQTPGRTANEAGINNGNWYRTGWDKPHDISITGSYQWNSKWKSNANFVFQTGRPSTFPNAKYYFEGQTVPDYGPRNANRLPAYHRLDFSAIYTPKPEKTKGWQGEWVFSIYNVYNRRNAASINFGRNEDNGNIEAVRLSIFGIVPSAAYRFKF
ncbi:TonB-dependent receptor [Mesonia sp.]|uniref:TonB-dependent receptor n=1 Tax=Mesonia sp. TaxID=1960830 RepID=UPI003F9785D5